MARKRSTFIPVETKSIRDRSHQLRAIAAAAVHWYAGWLLANGNRDQIFESQR